MVSQTSLSHAAAKGFAANRLRCAIAIFLLWGYRMSRTPASLLERLKNTDNQDAWRRFVELYAPMIYGWASRAGLGCNEASDLAQDVFLVLVEKMRDFHYDGQRSFRAWLKTVTLNKWREKARHRLPGAAVMAGSGLAEAAGLNPVDLFEETEYRRQLVRRAMEIVQGDFEPATWRAWRAFVVEGRPAKEVAIETGLTVNAVYLAKGRVLARLREELDGLME
jgi:RNA polymerase sigma-70 factor, ECF subfamily